MIPASKNLPMNRWLDLKKTMEANTNNSDLGDLYSYIKHRQSILDILEDFKSSNNAKEQKITKKSAGRTQDTNVVNAQKRMMERKAERANKAGSLYLKEFKTKKDGKDHFLIINKKPKTQPLNKLDYEDIFRDWRYNLDSIETMRAEALANRKKRTRKLSNR